MPSLARSKGISKSGTENPIGSQQIGVGHRVPHKYLSTYQGNSILTRGAACGIMEGEGRERRGGAGRGTNLKY